MPENKQSKNKTENDYLNNETNLTIYADHYGLTPQFIENNKKRIDDIEKKINRTLKYTDQADDVTSMFNTMDTMQKIIQGFVIFMLLLSLAGVFITLFQVMMG